MRATRLQCLRYGESFNNMDFEYFAVEWENLIQKKKKSYNWRVAVLSSHFLCTHSTLHSAHCSQNWTIKMLIRNNAYSYVRTAIVMYANRCEPLGSQSYVAPLRHCQKNFRLGVRTSMYALGDEGKLTHTFYFSVHTFYYNSIIAGNVKTVRR